MFHGSFIIGIMMSTVFFVIEINVMKLDFLILQKKDEIYLPIHALVYCIMSK